MYNFPQLVGIAQQLQKGFNAADSAAEKELELCIRLLQRSLGDAHEVQKLRVRSPVAFRDVGRDRDG
jgi:hypothetical protein